MDSSLTISICPVYHTGTKTWVNSREPLKALYLVLVGETLVFGLGLKDYGMIVWTRIKGLKDYRISV